MAQLQSLRVKLDSTGRVTTIRLQDKETTVSGLKKRIHAEVSSPLPHLQRLSFQGRGGQMVTLEDGERLSSYTGIQEASVIDLVTLPHFEIHVKGADERMHTIPVPEDYYVASLLTLLTENDVHKDFSKHRVRLEKERLHVHRDGKKLTLRDYNIRRGETLFIVDHGRVLEIIKNPKVDVCFMVDCTGSMGRYIEAVKNSVEQLEADLIEKYQGCDIRFAFVRYTDYDVKSDRTTWLDFTTDQSVFHSFVSGITADGGGDGPEDVMGGLQAVFSKLSWRPGAYVSRVLVHIADAPCHGRQYHTMSDTYPDGDPRGISHEEMMKKVRDNQIFYWFGYINQSNTDQMIAVFKKCLYETSGQRLLIRQFDALQPSEVAECIYRLVCTSVFSATYHRR